MTCTIIVLHAEENQGKFYCKKVHGPTRNRTRYPQPGLARMFTVSVIWAFLQKGCSNNVWLFVNRSYLETQYCCPIRYLEDWIPWIVMDIKRLIQRWHTNGRFSIRILVGWIMQQAFRPISINNISVDACKWSWLSAGGRLQIFNKKKKKHDQNAAAPSVAVLFLFIVRFICHTNIPPAFSLFLCEIWDGGNRVGQRELF